jgi:hypothetical protein
MPWSLAQKSKRQTARLDCEVSARRRDGLGGVETPGGLVIIRAMAVLSRVLAKLVLWSGQSRLPILGLAALPEDVDPGNAGFTRWTANYTDFVRIVKAVRCSGGGINIFLTMTATFTD